MGIYYLVGINIQLCLIRSGWYRYRVPFLIRSLIVLMQIFSFRFYCADFFLCIALCTLLCILFYTSLCGFLCFLLYFLSYILLYKFYCMYFIVQILLYALLAGFLRENLLCRINGANYNHRILSTYIAIFCYTDFIVKLFVLLCRFYCVDFIVQILLSKLCRIFHYADFPVQILLYT